MFGLLTSLAGLAVLLLAASLSATRGPAEETDSVALFLRFVRSTGEPKLTALQDIELIRLGMATSESLREYDGDVNLTILAALSSGVALDVVLPVVVGTGHFLCPEFKDDVNQVGPLGSALRR